MDACHFLNLPRELRDRIYEYLLSTKQTKTPKACNTGFRPTGSPYNWNLSTSSPYTWNLNPTILRANRQIHTEASEVLGRSNDFVVIERVAKQENIMGVILWPCKPSQRIEVSGERMRFSLWENGRAATGDLYVLLMEELPDFCIALSVFSDPDPHSYGIPGIDVAVTLKAAEGLVATEAGHKAELLLLPLAKLRLLGSITIAGAPAETVKAYVEQTTSEDFDETFIITTIRDFIYDGDRARDVGHFDVASTCYQRASEFLHHTANNWRTTFTHPADPLAFEFAIMQHCALNWIEDDKFRNALEAAKIALQNANQLFLINNTMPTLPHLDARWRMKKGPLRKWTCERIKEGAERCEQRIKAEDIGRCYYYKSICEHIVFGDEMSETAEKDKLTGIGCCIVSDTATDEENIPKELLELDIRTMERLSAKGYVGTGEDCEWVDDEYEDEEDETEVD